ncbi:MAG: tRNA 2-thiouridine(34) synthase MnmA [Clostridia bacterium]|nr:tRNA 2-thiouridine(34) synthase MnmA [Clostridia bacterium]
MDKVIVGMSGGVDSSVAAVLLKKAGYDVIGVTLNVWENSDGNNFAEDAKYICEKLEIPYLVVDYKKEFEQNVILPFVNEYIEGRTPNPCILCNRYIKFEALLDYANKIGAKYIATGHYSRIEQDKETGRYYIKKSASDRKDQTYALYDLTQEQLSRVIMPLGDYTKEEIRNIAEQNGLINANRKDSQEICFVENNDYAKFIQDRFGYVSKPGNFVDSSGKVYGKNKGIIHYTVGQRRGLGLSLKHPMYVLKIDKDKNNVIIGNEKDLETTQLECKKLNFMLIEKLEKPIKVMAKIRYNAKPAPATISNVDNGNVKVVFEEPVKGVAPGQAVVFYIDDKVLGGGIII